MTNTFRKHHKTIMWIIIVGTIVSFVYFLSPSARNAGGGGSSRPAMTYGSIDGEPINDQQFTGAMQEAKIFFRFNQGRWPTARDGAAITNIGYQRLFIQAELKQMNLHVTEDAAADYTRGIFGLKPGQPFPQDDFNKFVVNVLNKEGQVGLDDFDRFVRNEVGQQLLISLFGMTGELISQKEAEFFFRRDNETMGVELARFPFSNYLAKVTFTPEEIGEFYTNNRAAFGLPPRVQVSYICFDMTNYMTAATNALAAVTNLDDEIAGAYQQTLEKQGPDAFKDESGVQMTPEAAKAKLKDNAYKFQADKSAQTNAIELAKRYFDGRTKDQLITRENLSGLASSNRLTVVTPPPFDAQNPPKDLELPPGALNTVFQLQLDDIADQFRALQGTNGFYLVVLDEQFPAQDQPLETVRDKVTEAYRNEKAMELVKAAGANFESAVRQGLARGQSFDAICKAQGIKPENLTPFAAVTPSIPEMADKEEFEYLVRIVYELPTGQCSQFAPTPTGGFLAYVSSRTPLDDAIVQRDIPTFLEKFRKQRQIDAYKGWMEREFPAHVVMAQGPAS